MNKLLCLRMIVGGRSMAVVALVGGLVIAAIFMSAPTRSATQTDTQPASALTVTVATATTLSWPVKLEASGSIAPWEEAVIGSQVSNLRLVQLYVNVGDAVKRGQLLASFDAALLEADATRLNANWLQAESNRKRALQLKGTGGISDQDVLQYETQADVAKALLTGTQLQLRYAKVIAPDDGLISARSATVGAVYGNGQELFRMIRQGRLEWRGELTALQLAHVTPGQRITLALPDDSSAVAVVRELAPDLNTETRLGIAYADIEPGSTARAGMYAKGLVNLAMRAAVVIPAASVVIRDGRSYVPRVVDNDRISLQPVTVGRRQNNQVEIVSGINVADSVVEQGAAFLNDGDRVHIVTAPAEAKE